MPPHDLRFSVLVLPNVPWPEFLRRCRHVEALGFDVLAFADHLVDWAGGQGPRSDQGPWFDLWTQVAAVAMATRRIRLATLVAQIPLRNPVQCALQALTVDQVSGGRLELGLGTGLAIDPSYRMMGIENWTPRERVARFGEYLDLMARLLEGGPVSYEGQYYRAEAAALAPRSVQSPRIPLMVAAMGPRMLAHAARHADIWNSLSFAKTFEAQIAETRERVGTIEAACARIGRDPATLRRSFLMFDPASRESGGALAYYESEAGFAAMATRLIGLGMSEIVLYYPAVERQVAVFERIAEQVLPALRAGRSAG